MARLRRHFFRISYVLLVSIWLVTDVNLTHSAEDRSTLRGVALVIGNSNYEHLASLRNPENDAQSVEALLDDLGFDTSVSTNRDARRLARDIDRFIEDASEADVAVLYYSGHGIEAGGENFIVPVDADLSSLDNAEVALAPISGLIAKLRSAVPLSIVLLDACRNDPFPPGTVVRRNAGDPGAAIAASGLTATRGVVSLQQEAKPLTDRVGQVIGFAAEPGKVALDGPADGNSPYASAVVRHLSAMSGAEFGTVLRMVSEEVYLKTGGQQRPWVNESLQRLLYFGKSPRPAEGVDGEILDERRQLLLTIASLPGPDRRAVEVAAAEANVPMDALYGMLQALGSEIPSDPQELQELLRSQTEQVKLLIAERAALKSTDPEILRLTEIADRAVSEGALQAASNSLEKAKARVAELETSVDVVEKELKDRRTEFADTFARSAAVYWLASNYLMAGEDYGKAFDQIERWDESLAKDYKVREAVALGSYGDQTSDPDALLRASAAWEIAASLTSKEGDQGEWAQTQGSLGVSLLKVGTRLNRSEAFEQAAAAFRATTEVYNPESSAYLWAASQDNLGTALLALGQLRSDAKILREAIAAYQNAIDACAAECAVIDSVATRVNAATAYFYLGDISSDDAVRQWREAVRLWREAGSSVTRESDPRYWAGIQNSVGYTLVKIGEREGNVTTVDEATSILRDAYTLQVSVGDENAAFTADSLCRALLGAGKMKADRQALKEAHEVCTSALSSDAFAMNPDAASETTSNLAEVARALEQLEK